MDFALAASAALVASYRIYFPSVWGAAGCALVWQAVGGARVAKVGQAAADGGELGQDGSGCGTGDFVRIEKASAVDFNWIALATI